MHILQSSLHVVQVGYGYILMLIIMTFNGWLFLAVCFGAGVGYLAFAKSRHLTGHFADSNEQFHWELALSLHSANQLDTGKVNRIDSKYILFKTLS